MGGATKLQQLLDHWLYVTLKLLAQNLFDTTARLDVSVLWLPHMKLITPESRKRLQAKGTASHGCMQKQLRCNTSMTSCSSS